MSTDEVHGGALLLAVASLCGGTYLVSSLGWCLIVFGVVTLTSVVYARTRGTDDAEPD